MKEPDYSVDEPLTPMKAIRKKCLSCNLTSNEVKECTVTACPLWPMRTGKRQKGVKRVMTEEQRKVAVARLAKAREKK